MKTFESDQVIQLARKQLFDVQRTIWMQNMACRPVYLSPSALFQLDEWVVCETVASANIPPERKISQLAQALASTHQLDILGPCLDLPAQWDGYMQRLIERGELSKRQLAKYQEQIQSLAPIWYQAPSQDEAFCHNDLSMQHVVLNQPNIIFDWEYCATSNRYFDLAACIEVNELSNVMQHRLLNDYAKLNHSLLDCIRAKVEQMLPLVSLTSRLWYAVARSF